MGGTAMTDTQTSDKALWDWLDAEQYLATPHK
jgi:hypothetical protein